MLIASYAKINLFLEVLGKLPNAYHQIDTVFGSIDLHDTLRFALTKKQGLKLLSNVPDLVSENNLISRIGTYLIEKYHPHNGVEIYLDKQIPIAAGLGGGSSNAAVSLIVLNKLWNLNLDISQMQSIASAFGSDLVYFLSGGTVLGTNRGEKTIPLPDLRIENLLLVNPGIEISSREAYELCEIPISPEKRISESGEMNFFNRLEPGIRKAYPEVNFLIESLLAEGAKIAMMSGSGSTCFGIFDNALDLEYCQAKLNNQGNWTKKVKTITREEYKKCFQSLS